VTLATFLATPALMAIWVHKPELFQPDVCVFMALISAAGGVKEHKYQFQISINHHAEMARFIFFSYVAMIVCAIPAVSRFGIRGFLAIWLVTETVQIFYTVKLNHHLFKEFYALKMTPLYKIAAVLSLGMAACWWIAGFLHGQPVVVQLSLVSVFAVLLLAAEYPVFGLGRLKQSLALRFARTARTREELTPVA
jgi:hypothetical protein